jgi:hypothetical protein
MLCSPSRVLGALLLTFAFVACGRAKHAGAPGPTGDSGEGGDAPLAGTGGSAAAGQGGGANAGRSSGGTGGGGPSAGSGGVALAGGSSGGSSNAGFSGNALAGATQGGSAGFTTAGTGGAAAGSAGSGPIELRPCNSSDGTGCEGLGYCVDDSLDSCAPELTSSCEGLCAPPYRSPVCSGFGAAACPPDYECLPDFDTMFGTDPTSICVGGTTPGCATSDDCADGFTCRGEEGEQRCIADSPSCWQDFACGGYVPDCAPGYAPAVAQDCTYVCVPMQHCGCEADYDCPAPALCDRARGRCFLAQAPAPRCAQPFDAGPCDAAVPAYAFVDGACKPVVYGGCEGNDNRFSTVEECLAVCEGMPTEHECGDGRVPGTACLRCGGGGGCTVSGTFCLERCETNDDCTGAGFFCVDGACEVGGCI